MAVTQESISRLGRKTRIKRASKAGRRDLRRYDASVREELRDIYQRAADELDERIRGLGGPSDELRLAGIQEVRRQVGGVLDNLGQGRDRLLGRGLEDAARIGIWPLMGEVDADLQRVATEAVQFVRNFVAEDGLQLSDRLWRIDRGARESITTQIESAIVQGDSASRAAQDFLDRGEPVPEELRSKIAGAGAGRLARQAASNLMTGEAAPYAQALQVFRTEINRAHGEAYKAAGFEDPDVIGTRFLLSPRHPAPDICDMHATVNRHGLGPGVYPRDRSPWPAHPNTLSFEELVYEDEVTEEDRLNEEERIGWLKEQPAGIQYGVLQSKQKVAALQQDVLRENEIGTPWRVLKRKYERKGIDLAPLEDPPPVPPPDLGPPVDALRPLGRPIEDALMVRGQKDAARRALLQIKKVHGDGDLPTIPIENYRGRRNLGIYSFKKGSGDPLRIQISEHGDHKELTLAHEIGHFLDHHGHGRRSEFSSIRHDDFAEWRAAADRSEAIQRLRALQSGPATIDLPNQGRRHAVKKKHLRYLLDTREIWARSYAQYIAERSGDRRMIEQVNSQVGRALDAPVWYPKQWEPKDFEDIAKAVDNLMVKIGWRK